MVQVDTNMGSGRRKTCQKPSSTNSEYCDRVTICPTLTVPTDQLRREFNTREQGPQGNYFTDRPNLGTLC